MFASRLHRVLLALVPSLLFPGAARNLQPECSAYLKKNGFETPADLANRLEKCTPNEEHQRKYAPDPEPNMPGATDTTPLSCRYGHPSMFGGTGGTCCGWKPHFNWVVATCEPGLYPGQFCRHLPEGVKNGGAKINYVAAYQFDGEKFVLVEESSVGDISPTQIAGNYQEKTGWEREKSAFAWKGGDWPTKYAPWGEGPKGPRGLTPPAMMWVLSAESFYYGAFYMLSQLTLNLEGLGHPTGTNCWNWELDPVEGAIGWVPKGEATPGNVNQLYSTNNAAVSGCMPVTYFANQAQGLRKKFSHPEDFRKYCEGNPKAAGCQPWVDDVMWSGGVHGSHRFENLADQPYVFAVVVDHKGIWIYRWIPDANGETGWPGLGRYKADRQVVKRPRRVADPRGLATDIRGDVPEAVILQPSVPPEASCLRSSIEWVNWQFGANALGAMAAELGQNGPGQPLEGAQNWWAHFDNTEQYQDYPMSIAGVPLANMDKAYNCNTPNSWNREACEMPGGRRLGASNSTGVSQTPRNIFV